MESASCLVVLTQQSSSLTARMHHNSQKRINTSNLLGPCWPHSHTADPKTSSSITSVSTTLLIQQYSRRPRALESLHIVTCVYICCSCKHLAVLLHLHSLCLCLVLSMSHLQHSIKDYLTIYIQSYHQWRWGLLDEFLLSAGVCAWSHIHICCPLKMDIFNPCFPLGGKSKSCQAENEIYSDGISKTAREIQHLYIWAEMLLETALRHLTERH